MILPRKSIVHILLSIPGRVGIEKQAKTPISKLQPPNYKHPSRSLFNVPYRPSKSRPKVSRVVEKTQQCSYQFLSGSVP